MTNTLLASRAPTGRRSTLSRLAGGLPLAAAAALVPIVTTAPAYAATSVICVGNPAGPCDLTAPSIAVAIVAANADSVADSILVGPGIYADGPYYLNADITLQGSGQGVTTLTLPASANDDEYVMANGATVRDLTVKLAAATSIQDTGLQLENHATAMNVSIDGAGTYSANGIKTKDSVIVGTTIELPMGTESRGIYGSGGNTVSESTISADTGFHHDVVAADTLSRVRIAAEYFGVWTESGTVNVDDTLIDLGSSSGTGLAAMNFNASSVVKTINANHVTIVGGGQASMGAYAFAAYANVIQVSTIQLDNSIVRGPETSLAVRAGNNGSVGGNSVAFITTSYSNWSTKSEILQPNGSAYVTVGAGHLDVDPGFVDAAGGDYRLEAGSLVVDHGDPTAPGPAADLIGNARVVDGDGNGTAVRDMGAYEREPSVGTPTPGTTTPDTVAPATKFTKKPAKTVTKRTVGFRFTSNEAGSTFQCRLDKKAWRACSSPKKVRVKAGKHVFKVRATDLAHNTDATPAVYRFKRAAVPAN